MIEYKVICKSISFHLYCCRSAKESCMESAHSMHLISKPHTMAEIAQNQKGGRSRIPVPRIDLTPMVDLGFLLITFFMFTTTLAQPRSLELNMPSKEITVTPTAFPEESTITVLLGSNHRAIYYLGAVPAAANIQDTSLIGLSKMVAALKGSCRALPASYSADAHELHVIIKPTDHCNYADVVQVVDYMLIHKVQHYAIVDATAEESAMLSAQKGEGAAF